MSFRFCFTTALLACAALLTGCASKSYAVLMESPDGSTGAIVVSNDKGAMLLTEKNQAVALDGTMAQAYSARDKEMEADFSDAKAAQPLLPQEFRIYFKTGTSALTAESELTIPTVLQAVRTRGKAVVEVTGHTDTTGDDATNERLGLQRAQAIATLLQANGLQAIELIVTSHGERNLLVRTPDDTDEPRNRRVEITLR